jgi:hypothetical protein
LRVDFRGLEGPLKRERNEPLGDRESIESRGDVPLEDKRFGDSRSDALMRDDVHESSVDCEYSVALEEDFLIPEEKLPFEADLLTVAGGMEVFDLELDSLGTTPRSSVMNGTIPLVMFLIQCICSVSVISSVVRECIKMRRYWHMNPDVKKI